MGSINSGCAGAPQAPSPFRRSLIVPSFSPKPIHESSRATSCSWCLPLIGPRSVALFFFLAFWGTLNHTEPHLNHTRLRCSGESENPVSHCDPTMESPAVLVSSGLQSTEYGQTRIVERRIKISWALAGTLVASTPLLGLDVITLIRTEYKPT